MNGTCVGNSCDQHKKSQGAHMAKAPDKIMFRMVRNMQNYLLDARPAQHMVNICVRTAAMMGVLMRVPGTYEASAGGL
jgi:hypothetical protein